MSAPMVRSISKKHRTQLTVIVRLLCGVLFALLLGGCANVYYANNGSRLPEAKYDTYYAPDYYPYYPWDGYYGGAYYYGE